MFKKKNQQIYKIQFLDYVYAYKLKLTHCLEFLATKKLKKKKQFMAYLQNAWSHKASTYYFFFFQLPTSSGWC